MRVARASCTVRAAMPWTMAILRGQKVLARANDDGSLAVESVTAIGAVVWPGLYTIDVLGKPHYYDDSESRRQLTWSPSVGSFEQEMPTMAPWLAKLPEVSAAIAAGTKRAEAISPPGK